PVADFAPFPDCPSHSFAQITIPEGSHTLDAPNGFTAYVYGTGNAESYAYSVGSFAFTDPILVDTVLCSGGEVNLGITEPWNNIYWYAESNPEDTIATGPQFTLTPPYNTDIYVAVGEQFVSGCTDEEYFSVENPDPPIIDALPNGLAEICQYQSVQLDVDLITPGTYFYTWTPSNTLSDNSIADPIASPLSTTTYEVLVSSLSGCSFATDSVTVEVIEGNITNYEVTPAEALICTGESVDILLEIEESTLEDNFDPGVSWGLWTDVSNGAASEDCGSISENALYFDGNGLRFAETIDLDMTPGGTVRFALKIADGAAPCDDTEVGDDVVLEYSINGGTDWDIIDTYFESLYPNFTVIEAEVPAAGETAATRFRWRQLNHDGAGTDNWALDDVAIGTENTANYDIQWTPSADLSADDIANPTASPLSTVTYIASTTDPFNGCTYQDSILVDVGQSFVLDMTPDTALCDVQGIDLQAIPDIDGEYDYLWTPQNGTINNPFISEPTVTPTVTTLYDVVVTSNQGCVEEGEVNVSVNALLDLTVSTSDDEICAGEEVQLSAFVGGNPPDLSFEWTPALGLDDPNAQAPLASPVNNVTYSVVVTDDQSGCVLSDELDISVFESFTIDAGPDLELCTVAGVQLLAVPSTNDPLQWNWTPAANLTATNISNPTITLDETAEFVVEATNPANCSAMDTIMVELLFESFSLGDDITFCAGETVTIESGYGDDVMHEWSTTDDTPSIDVTTPGVYTVNVTSIDGCQDSDEIELFMQDLPVIDLGTDPGLCEGEQYTIDAGNPGMQYDWSTTDNTQTITVNESDTYTVTVTDNFDCQTTESITLTFFTNPVLNLPEVVNICEDEIVTLDAENPESTYNWITTENTQTIQVNQNGIYTVNVTNAENCSSTDQTELIVATYPIVDLGEDQVFCQGESYVLDAGNPTLNHNWSTTDQTQTINVTSTGVYSVVVDNEYCFSMDEVSVVFNPLPADNLPLDTVICFQDPPYGLLINAGNNGSTYQWSGGGTDQTFFVSNPGLTTVQVTTQNNCSQTFDFAVLEQCLGDIYVPNSFTPNQDGINDVFMVKGTPVAFYELTIWNRWGEIVFESTDMNEVWDGSHQRGDYYVESETYVYQLNYKYFDEITGGVSDWVTKDGFVSVIR
ncbi:MAG: gliding motility-associated C-terminal domain-containing protein, partial [Flavobacteriales bacterium]|nr:gliding motility-associated C-terminal domain-containing protein [Flavobacteriales bacterium]